jgi:hypothetical protein
MPYRGLEDGVGLTQATTLGLDHPDAASRTPTAERLAAARPMSRPELREVLRGEATAPVGPGVASAPAESRVARLAAPPEPGPPILKGSRLARSMVTGAVGSAGAIAGGVAVAARQLGIPEDLFRDFQLGAQELAARTGVADPTYAERVFKALGASAMFLTPGLGVAGWTARLMQAAPRVASLAGASTETVVKALATAGRTYEGALAEGQSPDEAARRGNRAALGQALRLTVLNRFAPFGWGSRNGGLSSALRMARGETARTVGDWYAESVLLPRLARERAARAPSGIEGGVMSAVEAMAGGRAARP